MKMITDNELCMMTSKYDFQYQLNPSFSVKFVEEITHKTILHAYAMLNTSRDTYLFNILQIIQIIFSLLAINIQMYPSKQPCNK